MANLLLERFLREQHGWLLSAFKKQHSFKQDHYPATIEEAVQMLK